MPWLFHLVLFLAITASADDDGRMRLDGASYAKPQEDRAAAFFDSGYVPLLKIVTGNAEHEALQKEPRKDTHCTVIESNGAIYTNVDIHLKGGLGSFRQVNDRPAMTLHFGRAGGRLFHGLDKLSLNNSVQDGTLCHEYLGSMIFRGAGLPVARVSHARVELNGRMLGVYVLMEGLETSFLKRYFGNGFGNFYDGSFREITDDNITKRTRNKGTSDADLKALKAALEEKDPPTRRKRLEAVLDVERFMALMACEGIVCHWDGYCNCCNNYRVYHNPTTDKLVFIGHGMDQILGDPNYNLLATRGWVARALTETAEDKRQYFLRVRKLRQTLYKEDVLTNTVLQIAARLKPVFETFDAGAGRNQAGAVEDLCRRIIARGVGLDQQLQRELGVAWDPKPLKDWQRRTAEGNPNFDEVKDGGKPCLRIRAADGNGVTASWRTRVPLPPGRYIFSGRVRTVKVPPSNDPSLGATLRISGGQRRPGITGSTDWRKVEYEFSAGDGITDIELVCELKAARGEAWFDSGSLTLIRKEENK